MKGFTGAKIAGRWSERREGATGCGGVGMGDGTDELDGCFAAAARRRALD